MSKECGVNDLIPGAKMELITQHGAIMVYLEVKKFIDGTQHIKYCLHQKLSRFWKICLQHFVRAADDILWTGLGSDIFIHTEKMGRMKYPVGIKLGRILSKMGRILSDVRPLF